MYACRVRCVYLYHQRNSKNCRCSHSSETFPDEKTYSAYISPQKDADNIRGDSPYISCTALAIMEILRSEDLAGKHCVILSRSRTIGLPLMELLIKKNATVTICHSQTRELDYLLQNADIIISGMGNSGILESKKIIPGTIVIDAGIGFKDNKTIGDLHYYESKNEISYTTVPGGIGLITRM
ncbi:bifunctional 5,10-methylenetetrahydrofolate dehydrogenase/5,10-methenyltetrahydrofolate cyclohydrolase [[Clostridium] symbiosum]|uniref:bifunctional 5,10-methylenetetrahydrofolate dehydrogenase/5,10-methenyltetrahydrofolate cyclohydrolase n=1 Tax=Clostridium symbiosum TaxID=1512 RepID=UPI003002FFA6